MIPPTVGRFVRALEGALSHANDWRTKHPDHVVAETRVAHKVSAFIDGQLAAESDDVIRVGVIDLQDSDKWTELGTTRSTANRFMDVADAFGVPHAYDDWQADRIVGEVVKAAESSRQKSRSDLAPSSARVSAA